MYASSSSSTSRKSRKRKRSPSRESRGKNVHNSNDRPSTSSSPLVDEGFSFEPYKKVLSKIITYSGDSNTIINHLEDFWVFLRKYEVTMKKAGKPLLEKKIIHKSQLITTGSAGIPISYSRSYCINFTSRLKFVDTFNDNQGKNFTKEMFDAFLEIVSIYLDFKNREKYEKLRKLRQVQKDLPVAKYRAEIVSAVKDNKVVIVAGDTGCGKSTQVPQYLHEAGYQSIACTQPRRIACISLSKRVSFEMLTQFQTQVGYQIRFEKSKNADTKICFITEGLLLRQMSSDSLPSYDVIILDEIHERHLMGDFLLGVLKCLVHTRNDLKLVLMSATINIKLFEDYFTGESAAVIQVPGRLYPIDLHYKPILIEGKPTRDDRLDPQPYVQIMQLIDSKYPSGIVVSIRELSCPNRYHYCALDLVIHSLVDERGDLLIFMSGVQEITAICNAAQQYGEKSKKWIVLPLHSALSIAEQDKVFDYPPEGVRKCIVSTNIAETSVTIDGIRFVADSGKVKEMNYDPTTKMQRLKEFWVSRASADQRKGRAGRTGPGVCYRVYSEKQYSEMDAFSTPEISRVPLASVFLLMTSLGMSDVRLFPFVDKPPDEVIENALQELKLHGALSSNEKLTPLGSALSKLPLEVSVGKALVVGAGTLSTHKLDSILALAAALGIRSLYTAAAHNDINCENARKPDESDHGDPLTLLSLYCSWLSIKAEGRGSSRSWCKRRGIEEQRLYEMTKLLAQLTNLLQDSNLKDAPEPENMSSAERSLRHGQMKQLKDMRRQYKQKSSEESKKKKRLKLDTWEIANDKEEDDGTIDIRDVEFRMTNDASRIRSIISGANASSGRDLMTLKMVLCRALYPQIALADEFNHCKSVSEQLFHTWSKPFVFLHPNSYFGKNPRVLQLSEGDIMIELPPGYKSKLPVSSKHQILCYLSLLETTKPYIVNSMRMPAAQTLLLLAHTVDTNLGFTRLVCDSWVLLEFPFPDSGINLVMKAVHLRKKWDALINRRLADANPQKSVETELEKGKSPKIPYEEAQYELSCEISAFMTTEVYYTVKRLLPGDLKVLYYGPDVVQGIVDPNPFEDGYVCHPHPKKGGVYVCDNLIYNCVSETDWSYNNYQELYNEPWACPDCDLTIPLSPIERLQHKHFTCASSKKEIKEESKSRVKEHKHNGKEFKCDICSKDLYLTPIEILKHKKNCKRK